MSDSVSARNDTEWRRRRSETIAAFAGEFLRGPNQELFEQMLVTLTRLAREDAERGDVMLLTKALSELRYALKTFVPYRAIRKVSIFGSARTPEHHPDYQSAVAFSRRMSEVGWMVITGAGDGIMKAGHGGAGREASFGVAISLPFEQKTNTIIADDAKLMNFRYFFTRKLMFMKESSAVALYPGGFGTQDEGFEALTLIQTGKAPIVPIVMVEQPGGTYWLQWRAYVKSELLGAGMISPEDMYLFRITDDVDVAVREVTDFYRVYHSMRYVGDDLVLRLQYPPSTDLLTRLNDEFGQILTGGRITSSPPLSQEGGELPELARVCLRFDRRSCGRLRRLIDLLNTAPPPPGWQAPPRTLVAVPTDLAGEETPKK
ncbi:MAG: LOG family protein [Phycisphaerales bacterium]|nr:LOG family protein [Phycisphaerales bacterium]